MLAPCAAPQRRVQETIRTDPKAAFKMAKNRAPKHFREVRKPEDWDGWWSDCYDVMPLCIDNEQLNRYRGRDEGDLETNFWCAGAALLIYRFAC